MSIEQELLLRYLEKARAVGVEAEVIAADSLASRLEGLVRELGAEGVAVPAGGWPEGMRDQVLQVLDTLGCRAVAPAAHADDFAWDRSALASAALGITWADAYLADTGSLVFPAGPGFGTAASLLPFVHLAISTAEGVVADFSTYLGLVPILPSRLTLVTGPSRTGDIEGTMTTGVHGPGRVLHWILGGK